MFRFAISASRVIRPLAISSYGNAARIIKEVKPYSTARNILPPNYLGITKPLIQNKQILEICNQITSYLQVRTVTKFSLKRGKRKTVKAAVKRFFRLHWGGWIRTKVGRKKKLWKKSSSQKRRLRQHVLCNSTQSTMLDKMVTKFWKRPKYYVDDPYAPYHTREEFTYTRRKPVVRE